MTEKELQTLVLDYLEYQELQKKLFFHRVNNIPVYDPTRKLHRALGKGVKKGFPDIIIIKNGHFIGIELKGSCGRVSTEQKEIEEKIKYHGSDYFVVKSLKELQKILTDEKYNS